MVKGIPSHMRREGAAELKIMSILEQDIVSEGK